MIPKRVPALPGRRLDCAAMRAPIDEPVPPGVELVPGSRGPLIARPNSQVYGHQVLEVLYALAYARATRSSLLLPKPSWAINEAVFDVAVDGVRLVRSRRPWALANALVAGRAVGAWRRGAL